jgi:hypothetical protein
LPINGHTSESTKNQKFKQCKIHLQRSKFGNWEWIEPHIKRSKFGFRVWIEPHFLRSKFGFWGVHKTSHIDE